MSEEVAGWDGGADLQGARQEEWGAWTVPWLSGDSGDSDDFKQRYYWICVLHTSL